MKAGMGDRGGCTEDSKPMQRCRVELVTLMADWDSTQVGLLSRHVQGAFTYQILSSIGLPLNVLPP